MPANARIIIDSRLAGGIEAATHKAVEVGRAVGQPPVMRGLKDDAARFEVRCPAARRRMDHLQWVMGLPSFDDKGAA